MTDAIAKGELSPNDARASMGLSPLPARMPQQRQLSEVAARAAQHVHDLEMALEAAQADIHALTARLHVADERARAIHAENEFLMRDRDYHKEKCVRIETKLNSAAQLILDAMSSSETKREEAPPAISMADIGVEGADGKTSLDGITGAQGISGKPGHGGASDDGLADEAPPPGAFLKTVEAPPKNGNGKKAKPLPPQA